MVWWLLAGEAVDLGTSLIRIALWVILAIAIAFYLGYDPVSAAESWILEFVREMFNPF